MKYKDLLLILFLAIFSSLIFLYKITSVPPCLNADEATNAYDAYSILKTGKDQHGNFLPLRFKSFGDYKLPLFTYLAVPFIKFFGLNEISIRLVNLPFVFLFPFLIFFLTQELFHKKKISFLSSFFLSFSLGLYLIARQAHEAYVTTFFLTLTCYFFLKFFKKQSFKYYLFFSLSLLISLFGYHFSRLWFGFFLLIFLYLFFKKKIKGRYIIGLFIIFFIFVFTDIKYKPTRIQNLLFFNNLGFTLKINELRKDGGNRLFYNKLTIGLKESVNRYLSYFSPEFLTINGDKNYRFGFPEMGPATPIEYLLTIIGLYFLFKNRQKWRFFLLFIFLFSPLSGSLTWNEGSISRVLPIFIPLIIIASYGFYYLTEKKPFLKILVLSGFLFFAFYNFSFYFFHYPKRAQTIRAWQCGYRELGDYIKKNYKNFDKFYITKKNGQPYIFLLFYLQYDPKKYQKELKTLTLPDEYGFNQVFSFDKFYFELYPIKEKNNFVKIGYPEDFSYEETKNKKIKEIKVQTETIFLIEEY